MADKKRYKALKSLETKDTKGVNFITAEDLKVRNSLGTFGLVGLVWFSFRRRQRRLKDPCVKARHLLYVYLLY
jgi:hypothetical protein